LSTGDAEACSSGADNGTGFVGAAVVIAAREEEDDEAPAALERRVSRRTLWPCCMACVTRLIGRETTETDLEREREDEDADAAKRGARRMKAGGGCVTGKTTSGTSSSSRLHCARQCAKKQILCGHSAPRWHMTVRNLVGCSHVSKIPCM
jgi:hypothetical protein